MTKAFTWSITAARSDLAAYHEALKMYERALELWDQVEDPESVAGPRATVLKQAATAASNAGEDERALALVNAALAEFGPDSDPEERINALMLKASLLAGLLKPGTVEPLREAMTLLPDDADPVLRARVLEALAQRLMLPGRSPRGSAPPALPWRRPSGWVGLDRVPCAQHPRHRAGRRSARRPRRWPSGNARARWPGAAP